MIAGHHSAMGGSSKYTPVYGVKSDGVSYCALPGNVNASTGRFELLWDFTTTSFTGKEHAFGSHYGGGNGYYFLWHVNTSSSTGVYCFNIVATNFQNYYSADGKNNSFTMGNNSLGNVYECNGTPSPGVDPSRWPAQYNNGRFLIFRANGGNSATGISPAANVSVDVVVIRKLKVWFGDTQVADLVPCRENRTGEVCFFNLIDGEFVKNIAGSGSQLIQVDS